MRYRPRSRSRFRSRRSFGRRSSGRRVVRRFGRRRRAPLRKVCGFRM